MPAHILFATSFRWHSRPVRQCQDIQLPEMMSKPNALERYCGSLW